MLDSRITLNGIMRWEHWDLSAGLSKRKNSAEGSENFRPEIEEYWSVKADAQNVSIMRLGKVIPSITLNGIMRWEHWDLNPD